MTDIEQWRNQFFELNPVEDEEVTKSKAYKNDMFKDLLPALDLKNKMFFRTRTPEQQEEIAKSMWILMRFMSSSQKKSEYHIIMVNTIMNNYFNLFTKKVKEGRAGHPELQWMLLSMCGSGQKQFHEKLSAPRKPIENDVEELVMKYHPFLNRDELDLFFKINSKEDLEKFLKENGYDDKSIKEMMKNIK